jgi:hypothetical protein
MGQVCCHSPPTWPTFPHQRAHGFLGDGQLLQEITAKNCPHAAATHRQAAQPQEGVREAEKLEWSAVTQAAFEAAKQALLSATHTAHPTLGADLSLDVDTSVTHMVTQAAASWRARLAAPGLLLIEARGSPAEVFCFYRELFACYSGIRHFRYMLDGPRFAIFTDHKPLT